MAAWASLWAACLEMPREAPISPFLLLHPQNPPFLVPESLLVSRYG